MEESNKYPGTYPNSTELARHTPHVQLSRPTPPDNTEWFDHERQVVKEGAKEVLCFDCQQAIAPGKGVQVRRFLRSSAMQASDYGGTPCDAIVHPECNKDPYVSLARSLA